MKSTIKESPYQRFCISVPADIFDFFDEQWRLPQFGTRSSYVRWLIVDAMRRRKRARA